MTMLADQTCEACKAGAPLLDRSELADLKPQIPKWDVVELNEESQLRRTFTFDNFVSAMAFANRVADLAEAHNHHPALTVEWGRTTVAWWTHKIGGIHKNDVIMAAKTDQLY